MAVLSLGLGQAGGLARWWETLGVCAGCVCSVQQLTVGGEKQVLANPTTTPPTPREGGGVRGGGAGAATLPLPPPSVAREQEDQGQCEPQASSVQRLSQLCVACLVWQPLPPDPDGSSHRTCTHRHTRRETAHAQTRTHTHLCPQAEASVPPLCLWVCFGYLGSALSGQARGGGRCPAPRCPFS